MTAIRSNYSFRVLREMVLTYDSYDADDVNHEFQKTILADDYLWYVRVRDGRVYLIDADGDVGSVEAMSYAALQVAGFVAMTPDWVPPQHANANRDLYMRRGNKADGDALARLM